MNNKEFVVLPPVSASESFSTPLFVVSKDQLVGLSVTTTNSLSLSVSVALEASIDGTNWVQIDGAIIVTTDTTTLFTIHDNPYPFLRFKFVFLSGSTSIEIHGHTKSY